MHVLIPFISAGLYLTGGQWWRAGRWLMGIPIGVICALHNHSWVPLLAVATYFIATNVFSYGEKMLTTKWFGPWVSMGISGLALGAASFVCLPFWLASLQTVFSCFCFLLIKWLDDTDKVKNPWVELLRGFMGTIVYLWLS
jgi:hypothetical protein